MQRTDDWYCTFFKCVFMPEYGVECAADIPRTYNCSGGSDEMLTFGGGVNNLLSSNWTEIHALRCSIENEWYTNATYWSDS